MLFRYWQFKGHFESKVCLYNQKPSMHSVHWLSFLNFRYFEIWQFARCLLEFKWKPSLHYLQLIALSHSLQLGSQLAHILESELKNCLSKHLVIKSWFSLNVIELDNRHCRHSWLFVVNKKQLLHFDIIISILMKNRISNLMDSIYRWRSFSDSIFI